MVLPRCYSVSFFGTTCCQIRDCHIAVINRLRCDSQSAIRSCKSFPSHCIFYAAFTIGVQIEMRSLKCSRQVRDKETQSVVNSISKPDEWES